MGAKGKNFYNTLACRYGYEKEATEIQDLYLAGKKERRPPWCPTELLEATSLCGPESTWRSAWPPCGRESPTST